MARADETERKPKQTTTFENNCTDLFRAGTYGLGERK
jgi:hypothetical protein